MDSKIEIDLRKINLPDKRSFHASIAPYKDRYICIYHNSEEHRLASCFVELDDELNFIYIEGTHTENLGISKYIDPRIVKYNGQYFVSLSCVNSIPRMCLFLLQVSDKITVGKQVSDFSNIGGFSNYNAKQPEKNWTPWQHKDKFLYVYSLNPHRILEVDMGKSNSVDMISSSYWSGDTWWNRQQWTYPTYRLNCPPIALPDGTYLSTFHAMRMSRLKTPWHKIQPNNLRSYWTGFYQFEGKHPFRVLKISDSPFMMPDFILPDDWKFHPPPSGGNPFYPFSMMLKDENVIMVGGSNEIEAASCSIPLDKILTTLVDVKQKYIKYDNMNMLLNDAEREAYKDSIQELHRLCPETISRKIPRANVQQGFMLDAVKKLSTKESEIICVGSHDDTACESLVKLGYNVTAIDPLLNVSLEAFLASTDRKFDLVFSTSVIEHVNDDELFVRNICQLLKPEGYAILTCDFNNDYGKPKVRVPSGDYRLYTKEDLLVRFAKILHENKCEIYGDVNYDSMPDFHYAACVYSFATYVFTKNK